MVIEKATLPTLLFPILIIAEFGKMEKEAGPC